jgi:shikimate dehydrogenase
MSDVSVPLPMRVLGSDYRAADNPIPATVDAFLAAEVGALAAATGGPDRPVRFAGIGTVAHRTMSSAGFAALIHGAGVRFEILDEAASPTELLNDSSWDIALVFSPWKEELARNLPELTVAARSTAAVDTVVRHGPDALGININTWAMQATLEAACAGNTPKSVAILGSGASAGSVAYAVRRAWGSSVTLTFSARNNERAELLATSFTARSVRAAELEASRPSVVVNCTTWGETSESESTNFFVPLERILGAGRIFVDLNNRASSLQAAALGCGAQVISGVAIRDINNACRSALAAQLSYGEART